ncbi:MAG: 16S rRNA (cytosine(967)-C(5))-methyltransferase RsmB [Lachnospiraceae bacterium]|nr:16S rRNA (cytosine(967)-C(5))-methyltransferase RsmB [Candidatus Merdinaster equi]
MGQNVNEREIVLNLLIEFDKNERHANELLSGALAKVDYLPANEKAFVKRLFEGVIEKQYYLEHVIKRYIKTPISKVKKVLRLILRMGVYQLLFMDSVPDNAACDEAVKLCKKVNMKPQSGFVNGVLRNIARAGDKLKAEKFTDLVEYNSGKGYTQALSIFYSVPLWLVQKFEKVYGREKTLGILEGYQEQRPVTVRFCVAGDKLGGWLDSIRSKGIQIKQHPFVPYAYEVKGTSGISQLPGYAEGMFYVQDVSSMLVCELADIEPGMRVIDVCSAPGGKGLHAAFLGAKVSARDVSEGKVSIIRKNADRLGYTSDDQINIFVQDARTVREEDVESADVVIADVPCSGYGIVGKKCDIKYGVSEEKEDSLVVLQREIIDAVCQYVKRGALLMYSTCTINSRENEQQLEYIKSKGFELESIEDRLPDALKGQTGNKGYIQLFPGINRCDGFFIARLRRNR